MSYINVTRSRSTTAVITPSTGSAITPAHPKSIKGITYEREVIEFSSMTLDQIRRITGEKKFELIVITCLYFKSEVTALMTVFNNNYRCSTVLSKPKDIANTTSTDSTLTITGQIAKIMESDVGDEGNKEPDTIEITIATDEITRA
jgi:hypothetical protein